MIKIALILVALCLTLTAQATFNDTVEIFIRGQRGEFNRSVSIQKLSKTNEVFAYANLSTQAENYLDGLSPGKYSCDAKLSSFVASSGSVNRRDLQEISNCK